MVAGLSLTPLITNSVFLTRRTNKGIDKMQEGRTLPAALANLNIATAQIYKAGSSLSDLIKSSNINSLKSGLSSAEASIKALSNSDKILKGAGKVVQFTANHINPIIALSGGINVLCAKDKKDALIEESLGLSCMFGAEAAAKKYLGMPKNYKYDENKFKIKDDNLYQIKKGKEKLIATKGHYKITDNKKILVTTDGLYRKNKFLRQKADNITKKITNTPFKHLPSMAKGLGFVTASICGYKIGSEIAQQINKQRHKNDTTYKVAAE